MATSIGPRSAWLLQDAKTAGTRRDAREPVAPDGATASGENTAHAGRDGHARVGCIAAEHRRHPCTGGPDSPWPTRRSKRGRASGGRARGAAIIITTCWSRPEEDPALSCVSGFLSGGCSRQGATCRHLLRRVGPDTPPARRAPATFHRPAQPRQPTRRPSAATMAAPSPASRQDVRRETKLLEPTDARAKAARSPTGFRVLAPRPC